GSHCNLDCGSSLLHAFSLTEDIITNCSTTCNVECSSLVVRLEAIGVVVYAISVTLTFALGSTLYSVTDAACYETLGPDHGHLFGQQRLWGTLGWGITSPLVGYLLDSVPDSTVKKFLPAVIGFTILIAGDMVLLLCSPQFTTPTTSDHFFRDLRETYNDIRVIVFTLWSFVGGILIGVVWTYSVWLLEELKASKTFIGLTFSMQSIVIEIPMFFVSGHFVKWLGHFGCMTAAFACLAVKLLGYSILQNPYYVLLVDVFGGAIFPFFYASLTGFANRSAVAGTAGTMQCLFGAIFEGAGVALGNFLCGIFIDTYSIRIAFRIMGFAALVCTPLCGLSGFQGRNKDEPYSSTLDVTRYPC
ncbi:major facilitator superfamily domain-containing protein 6-like, partial [Tropilaelaps mercedesae]